MLKLLLTAAIPFQGLIDRPSPTHPFINRQALVILAEDGRSREASWLERYIDMFIAGCDWADTGWRNVGHMYDPTTGMGFKGWPSAPQMVRDHWDLAFRYLRERDYPQCFFYLGAAAHLVQDLCVPHHAAARVFYGHREFERYARRYRHRYAAHRGGLYEMARTPEGWVIFNADYTSRNYRHCISPELTRQTIHAAVSDLLPRAQRTTAGFVSFFLRAAGVV